MTERAADLLDYFQRHRDINISASLIDNPNNRWVGPETVAAAEKALKAAVYDPPGR